MNYFQRIRFMRGEWHRHYIGEGENARRRLPTEVLTSAEAKELGVYVEPADTLPSGPPDAVADEATPSTPAPQDLTDAFVLGHG